MKQIQWFPGHMQKARRQIEEKLPIVDIVYEILDARVPESSRNPLLREIVKNKPILLILNKSDLADSIHTKAWVEFYQEKGYACVVCNALSGNPLKEVVQKTQSILKDLIKKEKEKGMKERPFRAMVVGIPNVGKSQFINRIARKNKVKTGNVPGVTKMQTYIKTNSNLLLLDNPGVLWPKFDAPEVGFRLALLGSIKDDILPLDEVALFGIKFMASKYPEKLKERYSLNHLDKTPLEILKEIGRKRGCLLARGEIDYDRAINLFLYDLRNKKLGTLSLETIADVSE